MPLNSQVINKLIDRKLLNNTTILIIYNRHHQMADLGPDLDRVVVLSGPVTNF